MEKVKEGEVRMEKAGWRRKDGEGRMEKVGFRMKY